MSFFSPSSVRPAVLAFGLILANFVYHLAVAGSVPLTVDEAHYALYGVHLALSYFDHPPMVGWLQALSFNLGADETTLRVLPGLFFAIGSALIYRLSFIIYPQGSRWQGLVAVLLMNSAPMLQLIGWAMVPDTPLLVIAPLFIWVSARVHETGRLRDWLLLGVLMGLAGLTKYTAVLLPVALLIALVQHQGLAWLRAKGLYLAVGIAALMISPVLIWNMQNEWISFVYQFDHGAGGQWNLKDALRMQLVQFIVYNPLLYVAGYYLLIKRLGRGLSFAENLCYYAAALILLMVAWSAGNGELLPHWSALGWTLMSPLLGHHLCASWGRRGESPGRLWRVSTYLAAVYALLIVGFVYIFLPFKPLAVVPFMQPAMKDMVGWREAGEQMNVYAQALEAEEGAVEGDDVVLLVHNWTHASRIAWYAQPRAVKVLQGAEVTTQFSLWFGHPEPQQSSILLRLNQHEAPATLGIMGGEVQCIYLSSYSAQVDNIEVNKFDYYRCRQI